MVEGLQPQLAMLGNEKDQHPGKVFPETARSDGVVRKIDRNILRIAKSLWNHRYAWPFYDPVDAHALNIPHYYKVITNPMDLGTIKKRLENNYYNSIAECLQDFRVMFKNCYFFNDKKTDIYQMAEVLEVFLKEKLKSGIGYDWVLIKKSLADPAPTIDPTQGKEKLIKSHLPPKKNPSGSSSSESDGSPPPLQQVKRPSLPPPPQKMDIQKENKPDPIKEKERQQQIMNCFKPLNKYFIKKNKPLPFELSLGSSWEAQHPSNTSSKEVRKSLKSSSYTDIRQLCADMIFIAKSTGKYQHPWTDPHKMAASLVQYIKSQNFKHSVAFKSIPPDVAAPPSSPKKAPPPLLPPPPPPSTPTPTVQPSKPSLGQNINHSNHQAAAAAVSGKKRGRPKKVISSPDNLRPITQKESEELNARLAQVPEHVVYQIVELVKITQPELINKSKASFEIDFEHAKPFLQWKIKALIEANNAQTLVPKKEPRPQEAEIKRQDIKKHQPSSHSNIPTKTVIGSSVQQVSRPRSDNKPSPLSKPHPSSSNHNHIPRHQPTKRPRDSSPDTDYENGEVIVDVVASSPERKPSFKWELPLPSHKSDPLLADQIIQDLLKKNNNANITDKIKQTSKPQENCWAQPKVKKDVTYGQEKEGTDKYGKLPAKHKDLKQEVPNRADKNLVMQDMQSDKSNFGSCIVKNGLAGKISSQPGKTKLLDLATTLELHNSHRLKKKDKLGTPNAAEKSKTERPTQEKQRSQAFHGNKVFLMESVHLEKNSRSGNHSERPIQEKHRSQIILGNEIFEKGSSQAMRTHDKTQSSSSERHRSHLPAKESFQVVKLKAPKFPPKELELPDKTGRLADWPGQLQNDDNDLAQMTGEISLLSPQKSQEVVSKPTLQLAHSSSQPKVLRINEALISPQSSSSLQAPKITAKDQKQLMKELSRINRQNYAKKHHVNFCTNAETQAFFDSLGVTADVR